MAEVRRVSLVHCRRSVSCVNILFFILFTTPGVVLAGSNFFPMPVQLRFDGDTGWYPVDIKIDGIGTNFETITSGVFSEPLISTSVVSSYNSSIIYDVSGFYRPSHPRVKILLSKFWENNRFWFLIGFDTGFSSPKINIQPSIYLGFNYKHPYTNRSFFDFGLISNIGGKVNDHPCKDDFDRDYYCGSLTAWSDFKRQQENFLKAVQIRYTLFF